MQLLTMLEWVDALLFQAVSTEGISSSVENVEPTLWGLHVGQEEVYQWLTTRAGHTLMDNSSLPPLPALDIQSPLAQVAATFDLDLFEIQVLIVAIAPEFDLRYERIYAYLQDDLTRKYPSLDVVLNLLCASREEKISRRAYFTAEAPLLYHRLIRLCVDTNDAQPTHLAHFLRVDEQIVHYIAGQTSLTARAASVCKLIEPVEHEVNTLFLQDASRVVFQGTPDCGQREMAETLAAQRGQSLLIADMSACTEHDTGEWIRLLVREAWMRNAVLYLDHMDMLLSSERIHTALAQSLNEHDGLTIFSITQPQSLPDGALMIPFAVPDYIERRRLWQIECETANISLENADIDALASRFALTSRQIANAVLTAGYSNGTSRMNALFTAARAQTGRDLATLTRRIQPSRSWADIVLPNESMALLHEVCGHVRQRQRVYEEWGFGRKLSLGKGLTALFAGPPGTGKTLAAEIIAYELRLDLYVIDLSQVVSKYIGETEKNLERIFSAEGASNAILFFDEADSLFGKRSEVRDSHDRYANLEISYLLQKMEAYEGMAILATNLRRNMDEAFTRRITTIVSFPMPEEEDRLRIWERIWPSEMPLSPELDLAFLARQFNLAGGNIKNIALNAAFLAADAGEVVSMEHLIRATKRELQKMGKVAVESLFGSYYELVRE